MAIDIKIPPMGESISSGVLAKWHVKDGDIVKKDQPLFELETDKITSEGTAAAAGRITLKAAAGDEVDIGQVVAQIDTEAASATAAPAPRPAAPPAKSEAPPPASPATPPPPKPEARAQTPQPAAPPPPAAAPLPMVAPKISVSPGARQT